MVFFNICFKVRYYLSKLNILVAEEKSLRSNNLKNYLLSVNRGGGEKLNAFFAYTAARALEYIENQDFHLLITDIYIDGKEFTGIDLVKRLNQIKSTPVIYLTDSNDEEVLRSIAQTSHSYFLSRPCNYEELLKIIKLTTYKYKSQNIVKVSLAQNIVYDITNRTLYSDSQEIKLTVKENLFLSLLFYRKNQIVNTEDIILFVWNCEKVSLGNMRQLICRAREKLSLLNIETLHGEGYRLKV